MKKIRTILFACAWTAALLTGCTKDKEPGVTGTGEVPVALSAVASKSVTQTNIYLTAVEAKNENNVYIPETRVTFQGGLDTVAHNLIFPGGTPYYPLGNDSLLFFAYSGTADGGNMRLTAGHGEAYDAVLSNYGRRISESSVDPAREGLGTLGSSKDPAELLQFRHVMTQLTVEVVVDSTETPSYVDPPPSSVRFTMDSLFLNATYPIRAKAPVEGSEGDAELATIVGTSLATLELGTNYLIPNGMDISGKHFRMLIIDDYTASPADLATFEIEPESGSMTTRLYPGYAYKLVITVRRLGVTTVTISQVPWVPVLLDDENPTYLNRTLALELGDYDNTGDDAVTKVVLHTSDDRLYVGQASDTVDLIHFVTLPASGVDRVDLYTARGLLLSTPVATGYSNYTLNLPISAGGMLPVDPNSGYGANNPYAVTTPVQLLNVGKDPGAFYRQTKDIDLDALVLTGSDSFDGLGIFAGVFDGNGHWISNVRFTGNGLFDVNNGELRNMRLITGTIDATGSNHVGSFCGTNNGTIVACMNEAFIANVPDNGIAGGIAGINGTMGKIIASINTGFIRGGTDVGGICGQNENPAQGAIAACLNTGSMNEKAEHLAGICGVSVVSSDTIIRTSYWLVGSAQRDIGGSEVAVTPPGVLLYETTSLDPNKMRNGLNNGEEEEDRILNKLNAEIARTAYDGQYEYILDSIRTGITWPAPVKR